MVFVFVEILFIQQLSAPCILVCAWTPEALVDEIYQLLKNIAALSEFKKEVAPKITESTQKL